MIRMKQGSAQKYFRSKENKGKRKKEQLIWMTKFKCCRIHALPLVLKEQKHIMQKKKKKTYNKN